MIVKQVINKSRWNIDYALRFSQNNGAIVIHADMKQRPYALYLFFSTQSQVDAYKAAFNAKMTGQPSHLYEPIETLERIQHLKLAKTKDYIHSLIESDDMYISEIAKIIYQEVQYVYSMHLLFIKLDYVRIENKDSKKIIEDIIQTIIKGE